MTTAQRKRKRFRTGQLQANRKRKANRKRSEEAEEELVSYGSGEAGKPEGGKAEAEEVKRNNWSQDRATKKSSYKEHRVDALAPYAEEGRGKLRKATGSGKQA